MFKRARHCQQCGSVMPSDTALMIWDFIAIEILLWVVLGIVCLLALTVGLWVAAGLVGGGLVLVCFLYAPLLRDRCQACREADASTAESSDRRLGD